jgi:uncharacterized membrane protein YebE (DUF533 family)
MFDPRELLGSLLNSGVTPSTGARIGHAMGPQGLGQSGSPLGDILGQLGGALGGGGGGGAGGGLADLAGSLFGDATRAVKSGHPAAVGGLGALAGALLGGGGNAAKGALGGGAMALLGTLAISALKNWSAGQQAGGAPQAPGGLPLGLRAPQGQDEEQTLRNRALLLVKAMANAAKADGRVDETEARRMAEKIQGTGDDEEARGFLLRELQAPLDLDALVRAVRGAEEAIQVYAASLLAIEVDTEAERDYLRRLAAGLGLDQAAIRQVHSMLGVGTPI